MLTLTILIAAISATLLICFQKWGWLDYYDTYYEEWREMLKPLPDWVLKYILLPKRCEFCFGFRIALLMCLVLLAFSWNPLYLIIPFASASITRKLL